MKKGFCRSTIAIVVLVMASLTFAAAQDERTPGAGEAQAAPYQAPPAAADEEVTNGYVP